MPSRIAVARSYLFVSFGLFAALASNCDEPPPLYDVASVTIVPGTVYVRAGNSFELQAVLRDSYHRLLSPTLDYDAEWWSGDVTVLTVTQGPDYTALVRTFDAAGPRDPATVQVRARALDREGWATIKVMYGTVEPGRDAVVTPHDGGPPSVGLADGQRTTAVDNETFHFVGEVRLDNLLSPPPGEVAVFSNAREAGDSAAVNWKTGSATISFQARLGPSVSVPLQVWNASGATDSDVDLRIERATQIFTTNQAGMKFQRRNLTVLPESHLDVTDVCESLGTQLGTAFNPPRNDQAVQVVLVQSLAFLDPPYPPRQETGIMCPAAGSTGPVIVINEAYGPDDVLAHELGHVMSLTQTCGGHTNEMQPFDPTNVMWAQVGGRSHLSLGQLFRMSFDTGSWVKKAGLHPGLPQKCGALADGRQPCPPLFHPLLPSEFRLPDWCSGAFE